MKYRIREALRIKGITSKQMASILGVSEGTFSGYVNGDHDPKSENLSKIALTCGVSTDFLLGLTDVPCSANKKNSPEPAVTDSEDEKEKDEIVKVLTEGLSRLGFLDKDGMISDRDFKFLCSLVDLMLAHFDQED